MRNLMVSFICRDVEELMPKNLTLDELSQLVATHPYLSNLLDYIVQAHTGDGNPTLPGL